MRRFKEKRPVAGIACVGNDLPVYAIAFCRGSESCGPDEPQVFAAVGANRVAIHKLVPGADSSIEVVRSYVDKDQEESFFACAWSVEERSGAPLLAVGGSRGLVKIINCATLSLHRVLVGHGNSVNDFAFHPIDANLLLSASKDESLRLWNVRGGHAHSLSLEGEAIVALDMEVNMDFGGQSMAMEMSMEMSGEMSTEMETE